MKYDISASDWLAFYGAYIGILIGSLSVIITIYFTNKEARLDRNHSDNQFTEQLRSSKMPYITFFHNSAKKPDHRIDLTTPRKNYNGWLHTTAPSLPIITLGEYIHL